MLKKPKLSFSQICNISFGFLGIQFGLALQNSNVSRIFETLGAYIEDIPLLWIAAPVTGLVVQPIVGYMSDRTWVLSGRRRPYMFIGALFASLSLVIMVNSLSLFVAVIMLWILDASINVAMDPYRAFIADMLPVSQYTRGYAMQSFFIGLGAVIGSAMPYVLTKLFGVENWAIKGELPESVKLAFYISAIVLLISVAWSVFSTKEYLPSKREKYNGYRRQKKEEDQRKKIVDNKKYMVVASLFFVVGIAIIFLTCFFHLEKEFYLLGVLSIVVSILMFLGYKLSKNGYKNNMLIEIITDFIQMPDIMKQLGVVQFFSWTAMFSLWIYATPAIVSYIFLTDDSTSLQYNEGANWVSVLFAVYNGIAALIALLFPIVSKFIKNKIIHFFCLVIGGVAMISFIFLKSPLSLVFPMVGVGIAWASILSMPYAMVTKVLPPGKIGGYMGIFNFFIVLPQILTAIVLGFFVKNIFNGESIWAIVLGGGFMIVASICSLFIKE